MEKAELFKALSAFQGQLPTIEKNKKVNTGKYGFKYADLAAIWEAIRKPLSDNGLSLLQDIHTENDCTYITTILGHSSGQYKESKLKIDQTGQNIQQMGAAITYYRRYTLSSMLGIVSDDDVDDVACLGDKNHSWSKQNPNQQHENMNAPKPPHQPETLNPAQIDSILKKTGGKKEIIEQLLKAACCTDLRAIRSRQYQNCIDFVDKLMTQQNGVAHA